LINSHHTSSARSSRTGATSLGDAAAVKLLWLAIINIEDKHARERAKRTSKPTTKGGLVEGRTTTRWRQALQALALALAHPNRISNQIN
jgi:hypothetical protein